MKTRKIKRLGWKRDLPDCRDIFYSAPLAVMATLPSSVDLRSQCPPVYDQENIGSCTANAIASVIQFERMKNGEEPDFIPSRLFIYYNERSIEGDVAYDRGANLRDGIKSVSKQGVCPESKWPYVATEAPYEGGPFPVGSPPVTQPSQSCYDDAANYKITVYAALTQQLAQLKGCLAAGYPFVFGFTIYSSWYDVNPHPVVISLPASSDSVEGGHAVACVGYNDATQLFIIRNSWGKDAGENGYFYMPYAYMTSSICSDFWVINAVAK